MRLTTKTRYGVRAIFDVAYHCQDQASVAIQAKDIARREEVPLRYLEQIFQDLRRAGLVESKRGPRGGYFLKRSPDKITLGDVVEALQGPIADMFRQEDQEEEQDTPLNSRKITCELWRELANYVDKWFQDITIADLVARGSELGIPRGDGQTMYFI